MKIAAAILAGILILASLGLVIYFNQKRLHSKKFLDNERYLRLTAEENLEKANSQIRSLERELLRLTDKVENVQKLLDQTQVRNAQLYQEVNKATTVQVLLEKKVKELEQAPLNQGLPGPI